MSNPLKSVTQTIIAGFILAIAMALYGGAVSFNLNALIVWLHVVFGIVWIGLLYYFNFVQAPAMGEALADQGGPGAAGINKYVAPRALAWFRWGALATWLSGVAAIDIIYGGGSSLKTFALQEHEVLGVGAWLGTIMLFNVWGLIWPNQKKILGLCGKEASEEEKAKAKVVALMASRTNVLLSIPMIMCMVGGGMGHGLPI